MTDTALPLIISLDPGRRCGFAIGRAGEIPRSGVVILRGEKEGREVGLGNLIAWMQITLSGLPPEELRRAILIHEEAMGIMQWIALCESIAKKKPFGAFKWFNADGVESGHELNGVILGMAQRFGIERHEVRRQSILKTVTGKDKHGGREQAKLAIIQAVRAMGLVEPNCKDDDRCDAVANFVYASTVICRKQVGRPSLFGATA
jgi:hypothetical protein